MGVTVKKLGMVVIAAIVSAAPAFAQTEKTGAIEKKEYRIVSWNIEHLAEEDGTGWPLS